MSNRINFVVNVEVAIRNEFNEWLIIERSPKKKHAGGLLALPGGALEIVDLNETAPLETCGKREIFEEVGIELHGELIFASSTSFISNKGNRVINMIFVAPKWTGKPEISSPEEVSWVGWKSFRELESNRSAPSWLISGLRSVESVVVEQMN